MLKVNLTHGEETKRNDYWVELDRKHRVQVRYTRPIVLRKRARVLRSGMWRGRGTLTLSQAKWQ